MTFTTLGLSETLLKAVAESGYTTPTPIQQQAIPAILSGQDVMAAAQTGTGKTAGFTLPLLQLLGKGANAGPRQIRALVLTPTRELAMQVQDNVEKYGSYEKQSSLMVCGGVNINPQRNKLMKGVDILVATPGRLLDLHQQKAVDFKALEVLVLDEADRMLDMGFIRDIRKLLTLMPKQRQNLMFSATFSDDIRTLARGICPKAVEIDTAPRNSTVQKISQQIYPVKKEHKLALLATLLNNTADQVLVFSRTKHGANNMVKKLRAFSIKAAAIHGNKSQAQRVKALNDFKTNNVQVLIATDIAARGIDIDQLSMVINFDLPQVPEDYVHRIGRTGRAGASGLAVSLVTPDENNLLRGIERLTKQKITRMEYEVDKLMEPLSADQLPPEEKTPQQQRQPRKPRESQGRGRNNNNAPRRGRNTRSAEGNATQARGNKHASSQPAAELSEQARHELRHDEIVEQRNKPQTGGALRKPRRNNAGGAEQGRSQQGRTQGQGQSAGRSNRRRSGTKSAGGSGNKSAAQDKPAGNGDAQQGMWSSIKNLIRPGA